MSKYAWFVYIELCHKDGMLEDRKSLWFSRGWFNTSLYCNMRWLQPSMCRVPQSTCTQHVILCTKCDFWPLYKMWIFTIFKPHFHHKISRRFQILMTVTVKLHPIKLKVESPLNISKLFQFQNSSLSNSFHWLLLAATTSHLRNAWWIGLETSCGLESWNGPFWWKLALALLSDSVAYFCVI